MSGTFASSNHEPNPSGGPYGTVSASSGATSNFPFDFSSGYQASIPGSEEMGIGENESIIQTRLGVGSGLFTALQAKHAPTASHCLRVALRTSSFARLLQLPTNLIDDIEVAGLLHDVGKISVPDGVLTKPGPLTAEEAAVMSQHWSAGQQILASCLQHSSIMDIVKYASVRFDGHGCQDQMSGTEIPLGARMLAVADAFDAMTTNQVYRPAMSHEVAVSELVRFAGTQFDPELVHEFAEISRQILAETQEELVPSMEPRLSPWTVPPSSHSLKKVRLTSLFPNKLVESMRDGVIFTDAKRRIVGWNQAAEQLTGIAAESVLHRNWSCLELDLRDLSGNVVHDTQCPVDQVVRQNRQYCLLGSIRRPNNTRLSIEIQAHAVTDDQQSGSCCGAIIVLRDISSEAHLRDQVEVLHKQATTDGLTGLNNRNLFDRKFAEMIAACRRQGTTCSVMIADIDFFKKVNDHYGHQAGDEVLVAFASMLRHVSRKDDWVARYGGEEFVILCPNCDGTMAIQRAQSIRHEWEQMQHEAVLHQRVTASFGVTELQFGDDPETMLGRADRALYQAKQQGRNRVVAIRAEERSGRLHDPRPCRIWADESPPDSSHEHLLVTQDPSSLVLERIQQFARELNAEIVRWESQGARFSIDSQALLTHRRLTDRPAIFAVDLMFSAATAADHGRGTSQNTLVRAKIWPLRKRDRRVSTDQQVALILDSLRVNLSARHA